MLPTGGSDKAGAEVGDFFLQFRSLVRRKTGRLGAGLQKFTAKARQLILQAATFAFEALIGFLQLTHLELRLAGLRGEGWWSAPSRRPTLGPYRPDGAPPGPVPPSLRHAPPAAAPFPVAKFASRVAAAAASRSAVKKNQSAAEEARNEKDDGQIGPDFHGGEGTQMAGETVSGRCLAGNTVYALGRICRKMQKYTVKGGLFSRHVKRGGDFFDRLSVAGARVDVFEQLALLLEEEGPPPFFQLRRPVGG